MRDLLHVPVVLVDLFAAGDRVEVMTPGGGGYGAPSERDPALVARDLRRGYYRADEAESLWGSQP